MIEQQGRVVRLNGNEAEVQIGVSSGCAVCDAGKGCGAGIFAQLLRRKPALVHVPNAIDARPGQVVTLGIPENVFMRILLRLYLLPLISALAGATIGHHLASKLQVSAGMVDGISLLGAALFFAAALLLFRRSEPELPRQLNIELFRTVGVQSDGAACQPKREAAKF